MTSGVTNFFPRPRVRALGTRTARPVRKLPTSSRRTAPRGIDFHGDSRIKIELERTHIRSQGWLARLSLDNLPENDGSRNVDITG